jgi:hypothetical protein
MAEALPPGVERLASLGRALEGTIDITQEDIDDVPSDEGSPSASPEALPPAKVQMLGLLNKKRTNMYRVCTRLRKETQAKGIISSDRWHQLAIGAITHLDELNTIESEIAMILKPTKKEKEKAKSYKKNLKEVIAIFGDY